MKKYRFNKKPFIQSFKPYKKTKNKKFTCLIFGGLGNQLTMASIATIFFQENNIKKFDFEYIIPNKGAFRDCLLNRYYLSKTFKIKNANSKVQKIYNLLLKFGLLRKYSLIWKGMKISILDLPFKFQMEINELEFEILNCKNLKNKILTNVSLIDRNNLTSDKFNVVIHFRDYLNEIGLEGEKYQLKESYFINAMRILKLPDGAKITVICYKKNLNMFPTLGCKYNLEYLSDASCKVEQSLEIMRNANILIMSNSTLSWWGAFGSEKQIKARKVVFPKKYTEGLVNWRPSYMIENWIPCDE